MVVENNSDFTKERLLFTSQAVLIIKSLKPNKKFTKKKNENQESSKAFWKKKLKITQKTKTTTHQLGRTILSLWSLMSYKEPIHSPQLQTSIDKKKQNKPPNQSNFFVRKRETPIKCRLSFVCQICYKSWKPDINCFRWITIGVMMQLKIHR